MLMKLPESITTPPPFDPIEGHKFFSRFPANKSLKRTGLHSSLSAKSRFYLPAFEISRSCRTASSNTVYRGKARTGDGAGAALESPRGTAGGNTAQVFRQNCQKTQERPF
jgi:hypothetical protein